MLRALLFLLVLLAALIASELRSEPGERHEIALGDAENHLTEYPMDLASGLIACQSCERVHAEPFPRA